MSRPALVTLALAASLVAPPASAAPPADAALHRVRYEGPHPVDPDIADGLCHIPGPHVHAYEPHEPLLYVALPGDTWIFVGDPVEFEAPSDAVQVQVYYGHHPAFWVPSHADEHWCYISGPHRHWQTAPITEAWTLHDGAIWYTGPLPRRYHAHKHRDLDRHYARVSLARPAIVVTGAPAGFGGVLWTAPRVRVDVALPGAEVHLAAPRRVHRRPVPPGHAKHGHWKSGRRGQPGPRKGKTR